MKHSSSTDCPKPWVNGPHNTLNVISIHPPGGSCSKRSVLPRTQFQALTELYARASGMRSRLCARAKHVVYRLKQKRLTRVRGSWDDVGAWPEGDIGRSQAGARHPQVGSWNPITLPSIIASGKWYSAVHFAHRVLGRMPASDHRLDVAKSSGNPNRPVHEVPSLRGSLDGL